MDFLFQQIRQLGMVATVMACAAGGTIAIVKIIRKIAPQNIFPQDPISRKQNEKDHS